MSHIYDGLGTTLSYSTDGTTWVVVDARLSIEPFTISGDEVSTVNLDSTVKETRKSALSDPGSLKCKLIYDYADTSHQEFFTLAQSTAVYSWQVSLPSTYSGSSGYSGSAGTFTAEGYVK